MAFKFCNPSGRCARSIAPGLEQEVADLEAWKQRSERAEDRKIEREAKEFIEAGQAEGKTLGEMLDQALRRGDSNK
jgi:flagellar biosynthesis/type III secretory pathway protein FliH